MLGRPLAIVFGVASLAMLVQFTASPLYSNLVDVGAIWDALSYVIAVVSLLALVVTYRLKVAAAASGSSTPEAIFPTIAFYATILIWLSCSSVIGPAVS